MKFSFLLICLLIISCNEPEEMLEDIPMDIQTDQVVEEPSFLERGVTYEGTSYHIASHETSVLDSNYMSTIIALSPKLPIKHPDGEISVSIELRYPLKEGDFDCSSNQHPQYEKHGEIIFLETINGSTEHYTSWAPYNPMDSVGAPGGYIKVFDMTEDSWSLEFGGGGNLNKLEDQIDWGRCGTGTILNISKATL